MERRPATRARGDGLTRRDLLVALGERIGLHQLRGLVDDVILAVGAGAPDAGFAPEMMVLVDTHIPFWRAFELDARLRRGHLVDVE